MYRDSFYISYWHIATGLGGYYGFGTDLFPLSIAVAVIAWRIKREPDSKAHLRGLRLLAPRQHNRALRPYLSRVIAFVRNPSGRSGSSLGRASSGRARNASTSSLRVRPARARPPPCATFSGKSSSARAGDRDRSGSRVRAGVLQRRTRRRDPESTGRALYLLVSMARNS